MILALLVTEQVNADRFHHQALSTTFNGKSFLTKINVYEI